MISCKVSGDRSLYARTWELSSAMDSTLVCYSFVTTACQHQVSYYTALLRCQLVNKGFYLYYSFAMETSPLQLTVRLYLALLGGYIKRNDLVGDCFAICESLYINKVRQFSFGASRGLY